MQISIPQFLQHDKAFVVYGVTGSPEEREYKIPYSAITGKAKGWNKNLATLDEVTAKINSGFGAGVGYAFTGNGTYGVDLDNVFIDGELIPEAREIVDLLDSPTERSMRGNGLHIFIHAPSVDLGITKEEVDFEGYDKVHKRHVELYQRSGYIAITGKAFEHDRPMLDRSKEMQKFYDMYFSRKVKPQLETPAAERFLEDETLLQKARQAKNGALFFTLWSGDHSGYRSQSEADLALCNILAFYCRCNAEQIDRMFRRSGLMRDKWDKKHSSDGKTYGESTISKAIAGCEDVYNPESVKISVGDAFEPTDFWIYKDGKGRPVKHWENTKNLCENQGIGFHYNELTKDIESDFTPYQGLSHDSIITDLRGRCILEGYSLTKSDMADHIARIAEENTYNPVRDYLQDCLMVWDGKNRTRELFKIFTLDPKSTQDEEFAYTLFEKWLITCVKMAFNMGEDAAQGVLVLCGPQGIGKTRFMFAILPNSKWGKTGRMIDLRDKDSVIQALGYWIVELGEYGRSLSAEKSDHYKAFTTENCDVFRTPYARAAQKHPRTTVFYATTDTDTFLKDDAGERRNWIIAIASINELAIDLDQLWGEVAHMTLVEKRPHWLSKAEILKLNLQNELYKDRSAEYEKIFDALDWKAPRSEWIRLTSSEVCNALYIDSRYVRNVGKALTQMKLLGVKKDPNTAKRKYFLPPFSNPYTMATIRQDVKDHKIQASEKMK